VKKAEKRKKKDRKYPVTWEYSGMFDTRSRISRCGFPPKQTPDRQSLTVISHSSSTPALGSAFCSLRKTPEFFSLVLGQQVEEKRKRKKRKKRKKRENVKDSTALAHTESVAGI